MSLSGTTVVGEQHSIDALHAVCAAEVGLLQASMSELQAELACSTAKLSEQQQPVTQQVGGIPAQACAGPSAARSNGGRCQPGGVAGVKRKRKLAANPVRAEGAAQRRCARPRSADEAAAAAAAHAVAMEQVRRALLHMRRAAAGICRLDRAHLTSMARWGKMCAASTYMHAEGSNRHAAFGGF